VSHWRRAGLILYLGTGPRQARQALMSSSVNADDDSNTATSQKGNEMWVI
jgi:hypothetical protein